MSFDINLEEMYTEIMLNDKSKIDISEVDFLGLNVKNSTTNPFELKVYFQPIDLCKKMQGDHKLIKFIFDRNMVKNRCCVKSNLLSRSYVTLKNKTYSNMEKVYNNLSESNPYIKEDMLSFPSLYSPYESLIKKNSPTLHMIGVKRNKDIGNIVNLEWLLRDIVDEETNQYYYNDTHFLKFIENTQIPAFKILLNWIEKYFLNQIEEKAVHLWIMAIDYYPNGNKKYKIYLKGDNYLNISNLQFSLECFLQDEVDALKTVQTFKTHHNELNLYGFAICIDSFGKKSINYYFVSDNN